MLRLFEKSNLSELKARWSQYQSRQVVNHEISSHLPYHRRTPRYYILLITLMHILTGGNTRRAPHHSITRSLTQTMRRRGVRPDRGIVVPQSTSPASKTTAIYFGSGRFSSNAAGLNRDATINLGTNLVNSLLDKIVSRLEGPAAVFVKKQPFFRKCG